MKLCFISSSLHLSGGVRCLAEIANRLVPRGHAVSIVIPGGSRDADIDQKINPRIQIIETGIKLKKPATLFSNIVQTLAMARVTPQCDVLISTHTPTTAVTWGAKCLANHGSPVWYGQDYREMFLDRPVEEWLIRNALRWHMGGLVVSNSVREELLEYVPGKPVYNISNGISDAEMLKPLSETDWLAARSGIKRILYLGDMRPRKGWFDFLAAADLVYRQHSNIQLQIVSKDDCMLDIAIPYRLIYRPSRRELGELYANCDVFVSASWWESFGLPGLEAMACGAPVVTTDSRGVREYAEAGNNCLIVEPRQPKALAEAVLQMLRDQPLALRLRAAGPGTAARFNWDEVVDRFESGLKTILAR